MGQASLIADVFPSRDKSSIHQFEQRIGKLLEKLVQTANGWNSPIDRGEWEIEAHRLKIFNGCSA